jgi:hypothetical protein
VHQQRAELAQSLFFQGVQVSEMPELFFTDQLSLNRELSNSSGIPETRSSARTGVSRTFLRMPLDESSIFQLSGSLSTI